MSPAIHAHRSRRHPPLYQHPPNYSLFPVGSTRGDILGLRPLLKAAGRRVVKLDKLLYYRRACRPHRFARPCVGEHRNSIPLHEQLLSFAKVSVNSYQSNVNLLLFGSLLTSTLNQSPIDSRLGHSWCSAVGLQASICSWRSTEVDVARIAPTAVRPALPPPPSAPSFPR